MPSGPRTGSPTGRSWVSVCVWLCRLTLYVVYVTIAALGALVAPPMSILLGVPVMTVSGVAAAAYFLWLCQQVWSRHLLTGAATVSAAAVPLFYGLHALQGPGGVIALVFVWLGSVVLIDWVSRLEIDPTTSVPTVSTDQTVGAEDSLRELLRVMPLDAVFSEWRALHEPPSAGASVSRARAVVLGEMQRRDPAGFAGWRADGRTGPPEHHIRGDEGLPV